MEWTNVAITGAIACRSFSFQSRLRTLDFSIICKFVILADNLVTTDIVVTKLVKDGGQKAQSQLENLFRINQVKSDKGFIGIHRITVPLEMHLDIQILLRILSIKDMTYLGANLNTISKILTHCGLLVSVILSMLI